MKRIIILLGIITLSTGCTVVETTKEKYEIYDEAVASYLKPEKVVFCYSRDKEEKRGFEARCFGEGCTVPQCPDQTSGE